MNKKLGLLLLILISFSAITAYASLTSDISLLEFGKQLMSNTGTAQVVIDLYIACGLICVWMYHDAKKRGKSMGYLVPFYLITLIYACIGPLLDLVLREWSMSKGEKVVDVA